MASKDGLTTAMKNEMSMYWTKITHLCETLERQRK